MTTFRRSERPRTLLIVANGTFPRTRFLKILAASADRIAACDGAADRLLAAGIRPDLVVGDMDSVRTRRMPRGVRFERIAEQESTDLEKLFQVLGMDVLRSSKVLMAGLTGLRTDFTLYNLHLLSGFSDRQVAAVDDFFYIFPVRKGIRLEGLKPGCRASFLPLERARVRRADGFRYPFSGSVLAPSVKESVSNVVSAEGIFLALDSGSGLLFVDRLAFIRGGPWAG